MRGAGGSREQPVIGAGGSKEQPMTGAGGSISHYRIDPARPTRFGREELSDPSPQLQIYGWSQEN